MTGDQLQQEPLSRHRLSIAIGVLCRDRGGPLMDKKKKKIIFYLFFVLLRVLNVEAGWCLVGLKSQFKGLWCVMVVNSITCGA